MLGKTAGNCCTMNFPQPGPPKATRLTCYSMHFCGALNTGNEALVGRDTIP